MSPLIILLGVIVLIALYLVALYNGLIKEKVDIDEAWGQIDVQLKRRNDLIPNLVETVKGYAKHEKGVFEEVTKARSAVMKAEGPADTAKAENMLSGALKSLFAVAENYPTLKANENFMGLQSELSDTEDKIAYARQYYNTQVMEFNVKIQVFPSMIFAQMMGFTSKEFFKTDEEEKKNVQVKFD
jgi:LemA protein